MTPEERADGVPSGSPAWDAMTSRLNCTDLDLRAALCAITEEPCAECGGTGTELVLTRLGRGRPPVAVPGGKCPDCGDKSARSWAVLQVLTDLGVLREVRAPNDDGAGGMFTDENGVTRSYSRPGTSRVVGFAACPVKEEG